VFLLTEARGEIFGNNGAPHFRRRTLQNGSPRGYFNVVVTSRVERQRGESVALRSATHPEVKKGGSKAIFKTLSLTRVPAVHGYNFYKDLRPLWQARRGLFSSPVQPETRPAVNISHRGGTHWEEKQTC